MTLGAKLSTIIDASPSPAPLVAGNFWATISPQRGVTPYAVYQFVASTPIRISDENQPGVRRTLVTIKAVAPTAAQARAALAQVVAALLSFRDDGPGIQRILDASAGPIDGYAEADRVYTCQQDLDVWDDLP